MVRRAPHPTGCPARMLAAAILLVFLAPPWPAPAWPASGGPAPGGPGDVLSFHGDAARTGWYAAEQALTPAALRAKEFGPRWAAPVEGEIYAQPLLVHSVVIRGAPHTVVYAVTGLNLVYAFDAADGRRLWGPISLGTPVPRAALSCGNIDPVGITSTPVIDRASETLYAVAYTTPDGGQTKSYKMAALDLVTGGIRQGWPVAIAPPPAAGLRFDPGVQEQRGALTLERGEVYVPFGGFFGDCGAYHGWVVGVPVSAPARQEAFATPTGRMGGIWATGGLGADPEGNLYAATGNSDSRGRVDLGESVVRLATAPSLRFSGSARDFFTPSNFASLNATDTDLGSAPPLVLPAQPGTSTPHLVFIAGKQGVGYLINRDDMGGVAKGDGITGEGVYSGCIFGDCRGGRAVFAGTAYWDGGSAGRFILVPGRGGQPAPCTGTGGIVSLRLEAGGNGAPALGVAWCGPSMGDPGAPAVSSRGAENGLVWVVDAGPGVLHALDARTGAELYASRGDALDGTHRFITPVVADGHVYIGAAHAVVAFGMK